MLLVVGVMTPCEGVKGTAASETQHIWGESPTRLLLVKV